MIPGSVAKTEKRQGSVITVTVIICCEEGLPHQGKLTEALILSLHTFGTLHSDFKTADKPVVPSNIVSCRTTLLLR